MASRAVPALESLRVASSLGDLHDMAAAVAPLDARAMADFERTGFAVVTLPLTAEELQAAADAWDRNVDPIIDDPAYIGLISHPCVEAIAKQVLRAQRVFILESGRAERPGVEPGTPPPSRWAERHGHATEWSNGLHSDVQVTVEDWEATPRYASRPCLSLIERNFRCVVTAARAASWY